MNNTFNLIDEKEISKNGYYSYVYAREVLKGRFELGEKSISKDIDYSYLYAKEVLKGRFQLFEKRHQNRFYEYKTYFDVTEYLNENVKDRFKFKVETDREINLNWIRYFKDILKLNHE